MSTLSKRAQKVIDNPLGAEYIYEHLKKRKEGEWDPVARPDGYVGLCIAENKRRTSDLISRLGRYTEPPPESVFGYDSLIGPIPFRETLAGFMGRTFLGRQFEASNLAVITGAASVLEQLFYALADEGTGVLVPTPSYAGFWVDLELRDALKVVPVPRRSADEFDLTPEMLDAAIQSAGCPVRALLFTNPDNPLGRIASREQIDKLITWAEARQVHIVFDEIYALSVFGKTPFVSAATVRPSLGEYVHIIWAFSKDFGASGLRCGVLVTENMAVLRVISRLSNGSCCSGHTLWLLSKLVADTESVDAYVVTMRDDLRQLYASVTIGLKAAGIPYIHAEGAFFLTCDLRQWLETPTPESEEKLFRALIEEANVVLTPGRACRFAEPGFFRLCYASYPLDAVQVGIARIGKVLATLSQSKV